MNYHKFIYTFLIVFLKKKTACYFIDYSLFSEKNTKTIKKEDILSLEEK